MTIAEIIMIWIAERTFVVTVIGLVIAILSYLKDKDE